MGCSIQIKSSIDKKLLYTQVLRDAAGYNFTHRGNHEKASFIVTYMGGHIVGEYLAKGSEIHILISQKPMLLTCTIIKKFLNHYINKIKCLNL